MTNVDQAAAGARSVLMDQIDLRTTDAGNMLQRHVTSLRAMSQNMRGQGLDVTANVVDYAANRINVVSTYLTQTDGDRIVYDVENVAREHTVLTAVVGLLTGLAAARLLKASASERNVIYGPADGT